MMTTINELHNMEGRAAVRGSPESVETSVL
jgi:hypothetical protein